MNFAPAVISFAGSAAAAATTALHAASSPSGSSPGAAPMPCFAANRAIIAWPRAIASVQRARWAGSASGSSVAFTIFLSPDGPLWTRARSSPSGFAGSFRPYIDHVDRPR